MLQNRKPISQGGPSATRLLPPHAESRLFARLRGRIMLSTVRQLLTTAQLRLTLAIVLSLVFWGGLFLLTYKGFGFLRSLPSGISVDVVEPRVLNLFYASLMVMLVFSSGIILYGGLYGNREVAFLLGTPARAERIFVYKFQEAALFSSWGFLLLGSPLLVAYGIVVGARWYYFALLPPYMIAFAFIPTGIGAVACLLVVQYLTRCRSQVLVGLCVVVSAVAVLIGYSVIFGSESDLRTQGWFEGMMSRLEITENRLLPSWWLSSGLMEAARSGGHALDYQPWAQSLMFLSLLVANAMLIHQLGVAVAGRLLRESYSRLQTVGSSTRRAGRLARVDSLAALLIQPLPWKTRLLVIKDFRIFRRDPAQWTQFLIFFALVLFYFINVKRIGYERSYVTWINVVSFLNVGVVGLILATFTTRFIFPLISLEGRRFWVLGLLPLERDTILWGKFLFAALGLTLVCTPLVLLSDVMLRIRLPVILVHQLTCLLMCAGLSAIAVGLGAKMPDLRETNPSKIAAGFGGTLNLVLSALYVIVLVMLTAVPCYYYVAAASSLEAPWNAARHGGAVAGGCAAAVVFGLATTFVSMRLGIVAFRRLEF